MSKNPSSIKVELILEKLAAYETTEQILAARPSIAAAMSVYSGLIEIGAKWNGHIGNLQGLDLGINTLIAGYQITSIPDSICRLTKLEWLDLSGNELTSIPESICRLTNLKRLNLSCNINLTSIPESICKLTNLQRLSLDYNQLTNLPESIGKLTNLYELNLSNNQLTSLPESIGQLTNLQELNLNDNPLTDLSPLQKLTQTGLNVSFLNISYLPRRYWCKLSDWNPEWLLDEENAEICRVLIQQVGYEKICDRLGTAEIDIWREYTLLKIDEVEAVFDWEGYRTEAEPMLLLKMTCPSTKHIHILRVPPEMTSAEAAITWINHGIHPDNIAVAT